MFYFRKTMAAKDEKTKEMWAGWTRDASANYEEPDDVDDVIDDMVDFATTYADEMLAEFEHRFADGTARKRKSKSRRRKPDDDEDDD